MAAERPRRPACQLPTIVSADANSDGREGRRGGHIGVYGNDQSRSKPYSLQAGRVRNSMRHPMQSQGCGGGRTVDWITDNVAIGNFVDAGATTLDDSYSGTGLKDLLVVAQVPNHMDIRWFLELKQKQATSIYEASFPHVKQ